MARKTLAVNTVVNNNGKLYGYNTDAFGLETALFRGIKESGIAVKTAVIYGNGGVSGVAFNVLQNMGIKVTIVGRDFERVLKKRRELGIENIPHFEGPYDLVVDATPISSNPDFLSANRFSDIIHGCKMVFAVDQLKLTGLRALDLAFVYVWERLNRWQARPLTSGSPRRWGRALKKTISNLPTG